MSVVVVTGLPGSGKTTLAVPLAAHLALPLVRKDHVKEVLADALPLEEPALRELGRASMTLMYELARYAPHVVLEAFFWPGVSEPELVALGRPLVQVHCDCPPAVARERFGERIRTGARHPVHHARDDWRRFEPGGGLLSLPGPLLRVDTTGPVDVPRLADLVRAELG